MWLYRAEEICKCVRDVLQTLKGSYNWQSLRDSSDWSKWVKLALKLGETTLTEASFLISTLTTLCSVVYGPQQKGISVLLEMIFSHSQFLSVMLAKSSLTKSRLIMLSSVTLVVTESTLSLIITIEFYWRKHIFKFVCCTSLSCNEQCIIVGFRSILSFSIWSKNIVGHISVSLFDLGYHQEVKFYVM